MFDQRDGFSSQDFNNADRQLAQATGSQEIIGLIREHEVFRAPHYHAHLRQLRYHYERTTQDSPDAFRAFLDTYDMFFTILHFQVHIGTEDVEQALACVNPFAPDYLSAVMAAVRDRPPPAKGPTFILPDERAAFETELQSHLGGRPTLPAYAASPGAEFALLWLQCLHCKHERLALRCYSVDLRVNGRWQEMLTARRLNGDVCPQCGTTKSFPGRLWAVERPFPADLLLALSCLCRVSDSEMIYMPPPGTQPRPEHDRIYEIRMEMMSRQLEPVRRPDARVGVQTNGVAYSAEGLAKRLQFESQVDRYQKEYDDTVQTLVGKISSGELPIRDAQQVLSQMAQAAVRDWPLVEAIGGEPVEVLVRRLVFACGVEARGRPAIEQISAHCHVADAFIGLRELGLAEMSIARAKDLLPSVAPADTAQATLVCRGAQEWLHTARGEHKKAAEIRKEIQQAVKDEPATPGQRLMSVTLRMNDALALLGAWRLCEAYIMMADDLQELTEVERLLQAEEPALALGVRERRSGTLANQCSVLTHAADGLDLITAVRACEGNFEKLSAQARLTMSALGSAKQFRLMQEEVLEKLPEVLTARQVTNDPDADTLRGLAERGLREAIALAQAVHSYEFLGIQWLQLAKLLDSMGRAGEVRDALSAGIRSAARAGDQQRVAAGSWAEALNARDRGDGPALFAALERCLRASLKAQIKSGNSSGPLEHIGALAWAAADDESTGVRAIAIAEGGKSVPLARSMKVGAIEQAAPKASALQTLEQEREKFQIQVMWGEVDDDTARERLTHLDEAIEHARRELAQRDPRYAAWHDVTFLDPPGAAWLLSAMSKLGPRATLLGLTVSRGVAYAYALQDGRCALAIAPADLKSENPVPWLSSLCSRLDPLLSRLTPDDHLLISPCEELRAVPWATVSIAGRLLVERASHSVLQGLGMFGVCLERPPLGRARAFALGAPARPDQVPLQNAAQELRAITEVLRQAGFTSPDPMIGAQATVANLCRNSPGCDVVHLACHAEPPSEDQAARLLLAPDLMSGDSGDLTDERILTEVALRPGAMVVMASCASGRAGASLRFVEGGLVPACLVAGATTVVATLWPIEDAAALTLLTAFYRHFAGGCGPAAALARMQRDAARGDLGDDLKDPRHWAAYEIYGLQ